jgi:AcrR family transcriptional regulator
MSAANATLAPRTYHVHRERQRRRILDAAQELFDEKGIDRVTMAEIVSASALRTSTLYQYFSSKDEIVWAILEEVLADYAARAMDTTDSTKTALARITALFELMADDLSNRRKTVRFMAQFDAMYAHDWPVERLLTLEAQINPEGFKFFERLIREGISDGSLRRDLDPELTLHAVVNAVVGAQRRLASLGTRVEVEYCQPTDKLFRETIRILLLGMRAT